MSKLEFWFDFGSPNSYFVFKTLPSLEARLGVSFERRPALLGGIFKATNNQSPFFAFADIPAKMDYTRKEMMRYVRHNGLSDFRMNPHFPMNTLVAMRGCIAAQQKGELDDYMVCIMSAMWENEAKIDDPEVMLAALEVAGLDTAFYAAKMVDPEIKSSLIEATKEAIDRGIFGMPTFFVGDEMFFGKDSVTAVETEISLQA